MTKLLKYIRGLGRHCSWRGKDKVSGEIEHQTIKEVDADENPMLELHSRGRMGSLQGDDPPWTLGHHRNINLKTINSSFHK